MARWMTRDSKGIVEKGYDKVAATYSRLEGKNQWPRMRWLRKVLTRLEPGSSVLDLGCGSGDPADVEIAKLHQVTGVDISKAQIGLARRNVPQGKFINEDLGSLDFPEGFFDAVVSFYALEHLPREQHGQILKRIHDWLKPGGLLLFSYEKGNRSDETVEWLGAPMFFSLFDPQTITGLVKDADFEIIESAVESQLEQDRAVHYLWTLARRQ